MCIRPNQKILHIFLFNAYRIHTELSGFLDRVWTYAHNSSIKHKKSLKQNIAFCKEPDSFWYSQVQGSIVAYEFFMALKKNPRDYLSNLESITLGAKFEYLHL